MLPMYKLYIEYTEKYKKIYGEKTVVLLQVGGFYEFYSSGNDNINIRYIAEICNMIVTKKSKAIPDVGPHNPYMTGFPIDALPKFINILTSNDYTCIIISQTGDDENGKSKTREVTDIISPSLSIISNNNNYLCVIYFEEYDDLLSVGISGIDIISGHTFILETISTKEDTDKGKDEIFRILSSYSTNEIILISNKKIKNEKEIEKIVNSYSKLIHNKWEKYEYLKDIQKPNYQEEILKKAFNHSSNTNIFDILNIERKNLARVSLCIAIQFAYEHNTKIVERLNIPFIHENKNQCVIEYDSVLQLNLISQNKNEKCLLNIINRCKTAFGKRIFKERLLNPINDIEKLNKRYNYVERILQYEFKNH